ncbi:alginate O-acetyltransferase AlgX-related protein [Cognatishimia maritima]|nr:hypothetical protein [Cognatishimia maritima]
MLEKISGLLLIGLIGAFGVTSAINSDWSSATQAPFKDGETQNQLETEYTNAFPFKDASISLIRAFEYLLFGQGTQNVVVGKNGWLFSAEEFQIPADYEERLHTKFGQIVDYTRKVEAHDVAVIIALIPDKARIMADQLSVARPGVLDGRYEATLAALSADGIAFTDLRPALHQARQGGQAYMKTDTHWSPAGASAAAQVLAPAIREKATQSIDFQSHSADETTEINGDLVKFVATPPLVYWSGPKPEEILILEVTQDGSDLGLFGDAPEPEGRLVGTSFSAIEHWGFLSALKLSSGVDILNLAQMGQGPFAPMNAFIAELETTENKPSLVIWEIPERYLTIDPKEQP